MQLFSTVDYFRKWQLPLGFLQWRISVGGNGVIICCLLWIGRKIRFHSASDFFPTSQNGNGEKIIGKRSKHLGYRSRARNRYRNGYFTRRLETGAPARKWKSFIGTRLTQWKFPSDCNNIEKSTKMLRFHYKSKTVGANVSHQTRILLPDTMGNLNQWRGISFRTKKPTRFPLRFERAVDLALQKRDNILKCFR